jgi:hypothetical protein
MSEPASRERLYLAFAVLGFIAPLTLVGIWVADNGFDIGEMVDAIGENKLAIAVFTDVAIASVVFWAWLAEEAPRLGIKGWGWLIPANLLIGLCFALPLYLYMRERALHATGVAPAVT